eukprot:gnl/TRDRNA2_/TRDRNA2_115389_c2_seq1.p1 gnl/TRDRNA2_/TRDRNA2_115389_c2~~gnl/TRDRNA2_/TRDRNA2_115389_c2_seq1.p1  ORF type:complete len:147 (+),score=1.56 gnl/TRDRNA2_/TRDRNA2_115389_c2_seq1:133-573(+)
MEKNTIFEAKQKNCTPWPPPCPLTRQTFRCDSRDITTVYSPPEAQANTVRGRFAHLKLQGLGGPRGSARDAFGSRLTTTTAEGRRFQVHDSCQGFNSQSSSWLPILVGPSGTAEVAIRWPSGRRSTETVKRGDHRHVIEPRAVDAG